MERYETIRMETFTTPICSLVQDLLPLYLEEEVSGESRTMITDHLEQCAHCAGFLAGAKSVRATLQQIRPTFPPPLPTRRPWHKHAFVVGSATMLVCAVGGIAGSAWLHGLLNFGDAIVSGGAISLLALYLIFQLARVRSPISKERQTRLIVGIIIGMLAAIGIVTSNNGVTFPIAVLLGIAAAGMVAHTAVSVE